MNTGIVYYGDFPENRGVLQLKQLLNGMGHDVKIIARQLDEKEGSDHQDDVVHVCKNNLTKKLIRLFPFNLLWLYTIYKTVKANQINCLFIRELPFSLSALLVAKWFDIPCILDMREHLPSMYKAYNVGDWKKKIYQNHLLVKGYERIVIKKFDKLVVVSDELKNFLLKEYELSDDDINVVGNFPTQENKAKAQRILDGRDHEITDPIRIVHAGYVDKMRGIQHFLPAIKILSKEGYKIQFDIIGDGDYKRELIQQVDRLRLDKKVNFMNFVAPEELIDTLSGYDIGLCGYEINDLTELTVPGKLFEYMCAGLAVFSSPRKPVKRILDDVNCGIVYDRFDPEHITNRLRMMMDDRNTLQSHKESALTAVIETYHSQSNVEVLTKVFSET